MTDKLIEEIARMMCSSHKALAPDDLVEISDDRGETFHTVKRWETCIGKATKIIAMVRADVDTGFPLPGVTGNLG